MESSGSRFITPINQAALSRAILDVVERFNEGGVIGAWMALKTLYHVSPLVVKKDVQLDYEAIAKQIDHLEHMRKNSDGLQEHENQSDAITKILRNRNEEFFDKIIGSLDLNGYWEKRRRDIPVGKQKGIEESE